MCGGWNKEKKYGAKAPCGQISTFLWRRAEPYWILPSSLVLPKVRVATIAKQFLIYIAIIQDIFSAILIFGSFVSCFFFWYGVSSKRFTIGLLDIVCLLKSASICWWFSSTIAFIKQELILYPMVWVIHLHFSWICFHRSKHHLW